MTYIQTATQEQPPCPSPRPPAAQHGQHSQPRVPNTAGQQDRRTRARRGAEKQWVTLRQHPIPSAEPEDAAAARVGPQHRRASRHTPVGDVTPWTPSPQPRPSCPQPGASRRTSVLASSKCHLQGDMAQGHATMGPQPAHSAGSSSTPKRGAPPNPKPSPPSTCPSAQPGVRALPRIHQDLQDGVT